MDRLPSIDDEIIFTNQFLLLGVDLCDFAKTNSLTFILSSRKTSQIELSRGAFIRFMKMFSLGG
jgi:hypothetical protein